MDAIYLDREKDPNNMFSELDKGLHSSRIGEQCSAIVRYPQLFKNYPFPIMIKSSYVKLANVFRNGPNYIRLCIIQVTQKSAQHLDKISNVGEIVRYIHSVMHSNDPVARALTLNMLGSMVGVIADDKSVQHSIITSLDSNDKVEVKAALFAANAFSSKSKSFSNVVCSKIGEVMSRWSVSVDFKVSVMQVCQSLKCDAETCEKVRELCLQTLVKYPTVKFVTCVLHTLTIITCKHLVHLDQHMEILLKYLQEDDRRAVRRLVLRDLEFMALKLPHIWKPKHLKVLFTTVSDSENRLLALRVLNTLSQSFSVILLTSLIEEGDLEFLNYVQEACYHEDFQVSLLGLKIYINSCLHLKYQDNTELMDGLLSTCEMLTSSYYQAPSRVFKEALKSVIPLLIMHSNLTDSFIQHLCHLLQNNYDEKDILICEFISSVQPSENIHQLHHALYHKLNLLFSDDRAFSASQQEFILSVIRILLQTSQADQMHISNVWVDKLNGWLKYKVARQASRYGHHREAHALFAQLASIATDEGQYSWLNGLEEFSKGEVVMIGQNMEEKNEMTSSKKDERVERQELFARLMKADSHFHKSIISLKTATSVTNQSSFCISYISLRSKLCACLLKVLQACSNYQTMPSPAIASSLAINTGIDSHRCQHILLQLKSCKRQFKELQKEIIHLYRKSFDADEKSLYQLRRYYDMVQFLSNTVHQVLLIAGDLNDVQDNILPDNADNDEEILTRHENNDNNENNLDRSWRVWNVKLNDWVEVLNKEMNESKSVLSHELITLLERVVEESCCVPMCVPRYFYQKLQKTDIKLAISPSMKPTDDAIWTRCETGLVLKIEGILSVQNKIKNYTHKPQSIRLIVKTQLISIYPHISTPVANLSAINEVLVKDCSISGDYFFHKFLLVFSSPGTYQVSIEGQMVDEKCDVWLTDVRSYLPVKAEASLKTNK